MLLDDKVYIELTHDIALALLKGITHKIGYSAAEYLKQDDIGEITGFPNEHFYWNDATLMTKPAIYLYNLYEAIKTNRYESEQQAYRRSQAYR